MLIAFDLDGVLFDAKEIHYEALNMALARHGHPEIGWDDHLARFDGLPTIAKLEMIGVDDPRVEPAKQDFTATLLAHHATPDRRLAELLGDLRRDGHTIGVVSNAIRRTVAMILAGLGLTAEVDFVVSAEDCRHPKPAPEPYLRAMILAGVGPAETVAVEDSDYGIQSATSAGCQVLRVDGPDDVTSSAMGGLLCVRA